MVGHRSIGLPECEPTESSAPEPCFIILWILRATSSLCTYIYTERRKNEYKINSGKFSNNYCRNFNQNTYEGFILKFYFFIRIAWNRNHAVHKTAISQVSIEILELLSFSNYPDFFFCCNQNVFFNREKAINGKSRWEKIRRSDGQLSVRLVTWIIQKYLHQNKIRGG